jgi:hypothetical protein
VAKENADLAVVRKPIQTKFCHARQAQSLIELVAHGFSIRSSYHGADFASP